MRDGLPGHPGRPGPAVTVRPARWEDRELLDDLWRQADNVHAGIHPDFFQAPGRRGRSREYIERILGDPDQALFMAEAGGQPLGMVHVLTYETPRAPNMVRRRRAYIENLVVHEGERGRGVGGMLIEQAETWARSRGARQILLTVWERNHPARDFYARRGYEAVSRVLARDLEDD